MITKDKIPVIFTSGAGADVDEKGGNKNEFHLKKINVRIAAKRVVSRNRTSMRKTK